MKRTIRTALVMAVLAGAASGAVVAYQEAARGRQYRTLIARGDEALREDQAATAIEAYSGAMVLRPESMLARLRRGEAYRRRGTDVDLNAAARDFRKAAQLDAAAPRPFEELGDVFYQMQRYDRAVDGYDRSFRLDDRSSRVSYKLALARYRAGDAGAALAALNQTLRLDDHLADAQYLRGMCLRQQGHAADAITAFEKAISLSPALIPAREELADLYREVRRGADALDELQVLAGLDRERVERHVAVALAHARAHHWDAAIVTLGGVLERMPDDPVLYRAVGQVWLSSAQARNDRVDLSKAREALEHAVSSPAATSEALTLAGQAAFEDGDLETAERTLEQAMARFPVNPRAMLLYAAVAERQNHLEGARRALIEYGALAADDSDYVSRAVRIATLSLRLNDRRTAAEWTSLGLKRDPQNAQLENLKLKIEDPTRPVDRHREN